MMLSLADMGPLFSLAKSWPLAHEPGVNQHYKGSIF